MTVVLVIDMQDGMWKNAPPEPGEQVERSELFDRIAAHREQRRKTGMDALAADIQPFVDEMRENGAKIVWVKMKSDEVMQYGDLYNLTPAPEDPVLWKDAQWVYPNNEAFFEALRDEAEANDQDLELKVCGVWALECVINSHVTLHRAGYNSRIIGDLIIDSTKPCQDSDRPDEYEAHALHHAAQATDTKNPAEWKNDILRNQRALFDRRSAEKPVFTEQTHAMEPL